jgi:hypothetical protein
MMRIWAPSAPFQPFIPLDLSLNAVKGRVLSAWRYTRTGSFEFGTSGVGLIVRLGLSLFHDLEWFGLKSKDWNNGS